IIPQAVCTRYGLAVGAFFAWPVRIAMWILYPISYPVARLLDWVLGHHSGVLYRRAELKELVALHGEGLSATLTQDEVSIMRAVLDLRDKNVFHIMTHMDHVFMLPLEAKLDRDTMSKLLQAGHSRVPVYNGDRQNIIGVVLVKQLLLLDPEDEVRLADIKIRRLPRVRNDTPLFEMLHVFENGGSHMAVVVEELPSSQSTHSSDDPVSTAPSGHGSTLNVIVTASPLWTSKSPVLKPKQYRTLGIVTLEDVIEELIGQEIVDETDVYVDVMRKVKVIRALRDTGRKASVTSVGKQQQQPATNSVGSGVLGPRRSMTEEPDIEEDGHVADYEVDVEDSHDEHAALLGKKNKIYVETTGILTKMANYGTTQGSATASKTSHTFSTLNTATGKDNIGNFSLTSPALPPTSTTTTPALPSAGVTAPRVHFTPYNPSSSDGMLWNGNRNDRTLDSPASPTRQNTPHQLDSQQQPNPVPTTPRLRPDRRTKKDKEMIPASELADSGQHPQPVVTVDPRETIGGAAVAAVVGKRRSMEVGAGRLPAATNGVVGNDEELGLGKKRSVEFKLDVSSVLESAPGTPGVGPEANTTNGTNGTNGTSVVVERYIVPAKDASTNMLERVLDDFESCHGLDVGGGQVAGHGEVKAAHGDVE
ncbi:hypothetical protein HK102_006934, partial [Quaeritorhiza haematococci]